MLKKVILKETPIYYIMNSEGENELSGICETLSLKFNVSIVEKRPLPTATIWDILVDNNKFLLINSDYGNYFRPTNNVSVDFIEKNLDKFNLILDKFHK